MDGYQRYMASLKGQPVDFLPRTPILMQYAAEYIGSDYAAFASDYRVLVEANQRCANDFGMDQVSCISDPYRETQGFGSTIKYVTDGPPHSTHPLEGDKNLSVLQTPDPLSSVRMLDRVKAAEAYKSEAQEKRSILGWIEGPAAEAADLRNLMNFMFDLMDDETYACELMDRCVDVGIAFAQAQVDAGVDTIGIGDAIASQVDPRTYERLIQPREKRLVQAIQAMGAYVKLHICGNITHLLPGIADLSVDILDVDHMVSLSTVRAMVGERVVLAGNMDPVSVVRNGTPSDIKDAVSKAYAEAGNPFMVNAGCEIPSATPTENLKALCEPVNYAG
ncbi:uroporphyrinogen decarboxylase family protein [Novipirellula artificiosorum]|uniref:Uroporphyrinogen decarboxylase n=1 Tax=Novipirellula artificiosorum TaxID=2528016 RepID=A0A5C6DBD1_9BACT|nr:uroporphyrinogen decarboxylase family protein [Novipirellula artificiosorum]TWU32209.1 Uroporphyrinogen decarboxylase [Novipirellula artificiosorum]